MHLPSLPTAAGRLRFARGCTRARVWQSSSPALRASDSPTAATATAGLSRWVGECVALVAVVLASACWRLLALVFADGMPPPPRSCGSAASRLPTATMAAEQGCYTLINDEEVELNVTESELRKQLGTLRSCCRGIFGPQPAPHSGRASATPPSRGSHPRAMPLAWGEQNHQSQRRRLSRSRRRFRCCSTARSFRPCSW